MSKVIAFTKERNNFRSAEAHLAADKGMARHSREESGSGQENYRTDAILISIVVPTRGRPDLLNRCLAALVLQEFNTACFEIIVVDDGPSHATREVAVNWAEHAGRSGPAITYIASAGPHGPAAARNRGWRAARGSIVAFTDDDTVARADWLKKGMAAFEDDSTQAAWGRIVMPLHHVPTDYELDAKGLETAVFVTANCFCRKATLEYLGGFDEQFRFAWREDADLYFRLLRANAEIEHVPAAVIVHPIRPARWGISLSQQKKSAVRCPAVQEASGTVSPKNPRQAALGLLPHCAGFIGVRTRSCGRHVCACRCGGRPVAGADHALLHHALARHRQDAVAHWRDDRDIRTDSASGRILARGWRAEISHAIYLKTVWSCLISSRSSR